MKLHSIEIELQGWGEFRGQYTGKVKYEGSEGAVSLTLNPEVSETVLRAIAGDIVRLTQRTADNFAAITMQSVETARVEASRNIPALQPATDV